VSDATASTLRPLGVGDIVDRTIAIYRSAPAQFFVLAAVPYIVISIVSLVLNLLFLKTAPITRLPAFDPRDPNPFSHYTAEQLQSTAIFFTIVGLVSIVILSVQEAAIVDATSRRYLGATTTMGESFGAGLRAAGRLIVASVLSFGAVIAICTAAIAATAVLSFAIGNPIPQLLGFIFIFVFLAYALAGFMPLPAVVTLERRGPFSAIARSWRLARGARWRILGLLILLVILQIVLGLLFGLLLLGTIATEGTVRTILQEAANVLVNAFWAPVQWGVFTLLYYDLRVRKEAFDLQLAAERIPRAT
jgi:hypothetical protein